MFEETLAYRPEASLFRPAAGLLAIDLEDDARLFYFRMATDIALLTTAAGSSGAAAVERILAEALTAGPAGRRAAWSRLFHAVSALVAACGPATTYPRIAAQAAALERLRQFLRENLDLADAVGCGAT